MIEKFESDYPLVYNRFIEQVIFQQGMPPRRGSYDTFFDYIDMNLNWFHTKEGDDFWESIALGDFKDAKNMHPELFIDKFKKGIKTVKNGLLNV